MPHTTPEATPPTACGERPVQQMRVFAVHGVDPEVQAYGLARYSRSALSLKDSLREIDSQKAEKFLDTFYFQYGHRSIADLAHVALAIENVSILAAIALVDEQRWDGQERSTRYQDFASGGYHVPDLGDAETGSVYRAAIDNLFASYESLSRQVRLHLEECTPRPAGMKPEAYERTLRARAFDASRYLLPLATNTSLGQVVNARTLETQASRLLSSPHAELRRLGEMLKNASREPAWNLRHETYRPLVEEIGRLDAALGKRAAAELLREVRVSPTLVKYVEPSRYQQESRRELHQAAHELMRGAPVEPAPPVDLLGDDPLEIELATTLLYEQSRYSYRQIRRSVEALGAGARQEIIALGTRHRGPHDELLRGYCAGQKFRFDILMDIGGFRDLHRHRRCVQIGQEFTLEHGHETPDEVIASGGRGLFESAIARVAATSRELAGRLASRGDAEAEAKLRYLIPLAHRRRTLFAMDLAEAVYICELRTREGGHISYRRVAYAMYEEVARAHPGLAALFRVEDPRQPIDLLKR